MDQHTAAMTEQAGDRGRGYLPMRNTASYLGLRRHTMGAKPAFAFLAFDFDLPAHVLEDPKVESLEIWGADLLILSNVGLPQALGFTFGVLRYSSGIGPIFLP